MGAYLDGGAIWAAIERLQNSGARTRLCEYLIGLRTLKLAGSDEAKVAESVPEFVQALRELTQTIPAGVASQFDGLPYFNPFGSARAEPYKSARYPSNGPSNTMHGWATQANRPFDIVDTRPKSIRRRDLTSTQLRNFLLVGREPHEDRPNLVDAAIWYYRGTDLQDRLGAAATTVEALTDAFIQDIGVTDEEAAAAFADSAVLSDDDVLAGLSDEPADPGLYLPQGTPGTATASEVPTGLQEAVDRVVEFVAQKGFIYEPWQIAAFVTAVRTKPFIILAGISGTGKSQLPQLVAEATSAEVAVVPVRPDWTDSSDLLGYERLSGDFKPGHLLSFCRTAMDNPDKQYFFVLDEMNVARVEYYFAEVLSVIEGRRRTHNGLASPPLAPSAPEGWDGIYLPGNVCFVGTVNMDETTHGFSRKVLDRAFVIELSDVDLSNLNIAAGSPSPANWHSSRWSVPQLSLAEVESPSADPTVRKVVQALSAANEVLSAAQLQVGFRVRDESALFCIRARECSLSFVDASSDVVSPLDLTIGMKVLPRIQGGGSAIQSVIEGLTAWAEPQSVGTESEAPSGFPRTAERLRLMADRLRQSGYTSYSL